MKDAILIIAVLGVMVFGFFIMKRLDDFLEKNRKAIEKEEKKKTPSCITLADENDDKILFTIKAFKKKYPKAKIVVYDGENEDITEIIERYKQ